MALSFGSTSEASRAKRSAPARSRYSSGSPPIAAWGAVVLWRQPQRLRAWLLLHAAVVLVFAPQIPTLLAQIRRDVIGEAHLDSLAYGDVREAIRKLAFNISYLMLPLLLLAATLLMRRALFISFDHSPTNRGLMLIVGPEGD